jgi:fructose transport system ATP-binding protein
MSTDPDANAAAVVLEAHADAIVLEARGLRKRFGHVTALDGTDFDLRADETLAIVGDNGAGKSTLVKILSGATTPDAGELWLDGQPVTLSDPRQARLRGIETVYQDLAVAPSLDVASNLYLGRELRRQGILGTVFRKLDTAAMHRSAAAHLTSLNVSIRSTTQPVEDLSGGQRQAVAVARAAAFAKRFIVLDEPTAALGVSSTGAVIDLIRRIRTRGLSVVLVSHNMPHVFELADRIHIQRLGRRAGVVTPKTHSIQDVIGIMTGA